MQFSNTKEDGLETIIVDWLVKHNGYEQGTNADYNKEYAIDETRLFRFLADTQPDEMEKLAVFKSEQKKRTFLNRLQGELAKRGIIDVLRNGIKVYPADLIMFYLTPNENNDTAKALYAKNIFSVTRQLRYSIDAGKLALDLCIFINGLPVITFELKNQLTKQNVENAVQQYKDDRSPKEQIFSFKRCMVHFAVDDDRVKFCTKLAAQDSWFLPFDKGYNDGAGNPPNPNGLKTDYLWKEILTKDKLTRIIESYAQVVTEVDEETKKKTVKQIFPRYHQLDVVEKLIADVEANGVGNRYLIQHSAGSGKSNSIAWLAYRLMELEKDAHPIFNSILVVTDRRILDKQIRDNIKQFAQVGNVVAWAEHSGDLRKAITDGKRIIITTIEKFPYVVPDIGAEHKDNKFAILIDEAHSGQNGRNSAQMNLALSGLASDNDMDNEDKINAMMEGRKLLKNASYFAFTATPKNKTLETFGKKLTDEKGNPIYNEDGTQKALAFHVYTMKQAIQEGFILDVLKNYTPIDSFYKLKKIVEDDPQFDKKKAQKKLRAFVESDSYTIDKKAAMMVEHFHEQVIAKGKIGGQARAMVVTSSIPRCIEYFYAINKHLAERHSPYKAIVAFSGDHKYNGQEPPLTSAIMNGFADSKIPSNGSECESIHLLSGTDSNGKISYEMVFGASNIIGDIKDAIDNAFEEIERIEKHGNKDIKMVEKTALSGFYNKSEIDFIKKHIIPEPGKSGDYEIAYGVFLGYTLGLNSTGLSSAEYKEKVNRRLELDIKQHASYIANKIITKGLDGHSFYFYILPFNDAETDKKEIMEHIMKGEVTL